MRWPRATTYSRSAGTTSRSPRSTPRLAKIEDELINGRGFVRLRGIDRAAYTQAEMEVIYWGIGMHFGLPWPQNKHGHVLGDVTDQDKATNDPDRAGNELGGVALPFHCDGSDLVGLMCLRERPQRRTVGGRELGARSTTSSWSTDPDLAAALYEHYPYDFRGEEAEGGKPYYSLPVFTEWDDRLFVRCIPPYIYASQRHADAPDSATCSGRRCKRSCAWPTIPRTTC